MYTAYGMTGPEAAFLKRLFDVAVASGNPARFLPASLPPPPRGRCVLIAVGKAASAMAAAVEQAWPQVNLSGVVATPRGHALPVRRCTTIEAGHPVPDADSVRAGQAVVEALQGLTRDDLVLCLLSGGGSACCELPLSTVGLAEIQRVTRALLACGAPISDINAVRRAMSMLKGGRLAARCRPAALATLAMSDVPGDAAADIASGPTVTPPALPRAVDVLARWGIAPPSGLESPLPGGTPRPWGEYRLVAAPMMALREAAAAAAAQEVTPVILGDAWQAEAREAGRIFAGIARGVATHAVPARAPCVLLCGGESVVTLGKRPPGRGGRNTAFLLSCALALEEDPCVHALAADTDGIDGTSDAAGAWVGPDTLARVRDAGLDPRALLDQHDSYSAFDAAGTLLRTGPTRTNLNDFRAALILPRQPTM